MKGLACSFYLMLIVGAVSGACERPRSEPAFPHVEHLTGHACGNDGQPDCVTCVTCHTPTSGASNLSRPDAVVCSQCHQNGEALLAASTPAPRPQSINFEHQSHLLLPEVKGQCVGCHQGVVIAGERRLPEMAKCLECHSADFQQAKCTPCHVSEHLSQLKPETFMRHDEKWWHSHAQPAARSPAVCSECHSETWCADCHSQNRGLSIEKRFPDQIQRHMPHRGDFVVRHAIEARSQSARCLSCHTSNTCDACHLERGVSAAAIGSVSPHPIGWIGSGSRGRESHGRAARRDIVTCMSCHDHGPLTNCIQCHSPGGPGGNPHPSGWDSSRATSSAMCRYCHVD